MGVLALAGVRFIFFTVVCMGLLRVYDENSIDNRVMF